MPPLKEITILISVLLVSLIIAFCGSCSPSDKNKDIQFSAENSDNISVFKNKTKQSDKNDNQAQSAIPGENQIIKNILMPANNQEKTHQTNTDNGRAIIPLSLETVLAQAKNLSSDLKLEFENIRKQKEICPSCGQSEQYSPSICATILASPSGGGTACTCSNTMGACCCCGKGCSCSNHPCCCVCCSACCR